MKRFGAALLLGVLLPLSASGQVQPRDAPPTHVELARREADLKAQIAAEGPSVDRLAKLAALQEQRGAVADAEATLVDARKRFPQDRVLFTTLGSFYVRQGKSLRAMQLLEQLAALEPTDSTVHYAIATHAEELVRKDMTLSAAEKQAYITKGLTAADRAIALDGTFAEPLVYKNILLRHQAHLETDRARQQQLIVEADALRTQAMELLKVHPRRAMDIALAGTPPPPPPPPPSATAPRAGCEAGKLYNGQPPVRVGGNIRPPVKTKDVRPMYPDDVRAQGSQGVVIIEVVITPEGNVGSACVLRSVPGLDDAALNTVAQWQFTPTLLNGVPVPVFLTVTVNFTLQ